MYGSCDWNEISTEGKSVGTQIISKIPPVCNNSIERIDQCKNNCTRQRTSIKIRGNMSTAPDRGWAWVILTGITIINVAVLPVQQCFGLIFEERFSKLNISATQISLILHLNSTIMCSLGLISGPMMKRFSCRTVAYFGSLTVVVGICSTAYADSFMSIILTYCVFIGVGQGIMYPATSLALNTYFRKKRSIAMGITVALTGLGPILMPLLIARLLEDYATTGTVLILGGIATNSFVGASLLRPFKSKTLDVTKNTSTTKDCNAKENNEIVEPIVSSTMETSTDVVRFENTSISSHQVTSKLSMNDNDLDVRIDVNPTTKKNKIDERKDEEMAFLHKSNSDKDRRRPDFIFSKISSSLDLNLLRDSRFLFIVTGMSVSFVSELNFNLMFPFVLAELAGLERSKVATVMSSQAAADIGARLCVPLLAQKAGWSSRNLYAVSLMGSIVGRTLLSSWNSSYMAIIGLSLIIGMAKGTKAVFQALVIPDNVPLERLPAASGLLMVFNGILSIALGPVIGLVHDSTHSYVGSLHFTSILSMACICLWIIERVWCSRKLTLREEVEKR